MRALALCLILAASPALADTISIPGPDGPLEGEAIAVAGAAHALVIIPGSGPTDRDGNGPDGMPGLRSDTYRMLAEALEEAARLQACNSILTCAQNALNALGAALSGLANTVLLSSVNIANGLSAEGNLTNDILDGLIGLELARADLELLDVSCGGRIPRLVR